MAAIGLMGGTFDPIHYGHLVAAEAARTSFGLSKVVFIPAGQPPHKHQRQVAGAEHRYLMTLLATMTNPHFEVSRIEMDRQDWSYTVDTVREIHQAAGPELFFITGIDAVLEICSWRNATDLFALCEVIAATRPGYLASAVNELQGDLPPAAFARIHVLEVPALAISSSDIRSRVSRGESIKYLVPEPVEYYIQKNGLYRQFSTDGAE